MHITKKHLDIVEMITRRVLRSFPYADPEEAVGEALLCLTKCADRYDPQQEATFETFIGTAIRNHIYDWAVKAGRRLGPSAGGDVTILETSVVDEPERRLIFKEAVQGLSSDAQQMYRLLLENVETLFSANNCNHARIRAQLRRRFKDVLKEAGGAAADRRSYDAMNELKALAATL